MIANFILATFMVGLTVTIHFIGLLGLIWLLRRSGHRFRAHEKWTGQGAAILFVVLGLVAIHTVEIWSYAFAYLTIGALSDFESALYFSTTSFTTIGYGDVVLDHRWRLFGAIEGPTACCCSAGRRPSCSRSPAGCGRSNTTGWSRSRSRSPIEAAERRNRGSGRSRGCSPGRGARSSRPSRASRRESRPAPRSSAAGDHASRRRYAAPGGRRS